MADFLNRGSGRHAPDISLVIPSYNRSGSVVRLLRGLNGQAAASDSFEVILVLDGCSDDSAKSVASQPLSYALQVIEQPGRGRAAARNNGIRYAHGQLILFLDDDMDADPELIAAHLAAHRENPGGVVLGYYPMPPENNSTPERERIRQWWDDQFTRRSQPGHRFTYHDFLTGNVSLSRDLLLRVNGFDESMPRIATCEDWELGLRLLKAGVRFRDCRSAWCIHRTNASTRHILYRAREEGGGQAVMSIKHPEIFFDLPLSRFCGVFETPALWPAIRLLWRYPLPVQALGTLLGRLYLLFAWLGLRAAQAWVEPYARRYEYWLGLRLVFSSAEEWRGICRKALEVSSMPQQGKEAYAAQVAAGN